MYFCCFHPPGFSCTKQKEVDPVRINICKGIFVVFTLYKKLDWWRISGKAILLLES